VGCHWDYDAVNYRTGEKAGSTTGKERGKDLVERCANSLRFDCRDHRCYKWCNWRMWWRKKNSYGNMSR